MQPVQLNERQPNERQLNTLRQSERVVLVVVALAVLVGGVAPTVNAEALAIAIAYDVAAFAAAALAVVGALRLPRERRTEWLLIAAGCFCFFAGDVVWDIYERVLRQPAPLPSFADAVYLLAYPLMVLGLLRLVRRRTDVDTFNAWLDVGVLAMAVGLLVWEPLLVDSGRGLLGALIAGAYPVFDVVLLGFIAALVGNRRASRVNLAILAGAGTLFVADLAYLILESRGTYATGGFPDPLFVIGTFLFATAPWFDRPEDPDNPQQRRKARPVTSTAIIVAALTALPIDFGLIPETIESGEAKTVRMLLRILLLAFVGLRLLRQAERDERLVSALDRTTTRLSTVIENTADAVLFVDAHGTILEWNAMADTLFGYSRDEVIGTNVLTLFARRESVETAQSVMQTLANGGSLSLTLNLEPQGRAIAVGLRVSAVLGDDERAAGFVVVARDETARVLTSHAMQSFGQLEPSDALAQFAEELKAYVPFDTLSLVSVEGDRFSELARIRAAGRGRDRVLHAAPADALMHGPVLQMIDSLGDQPYVILRPHHYGAYQERVTGAGVNETITLPLRDALTAELQGLLSLGFADEGAATTVVAESLVRIAPELARSVANMTLYAQQRRTSERLQELDDLRDGFFELVAHEVRSPLGAIGTAASVLRDHGPAMSADAARELAAGITDSARRLARLTGDLVDASRGGRGTFPCEIGPVDDLGTIVGTAAAAAAAGEVGRVSVDVAAGVAIEGDPDRLAQIVANLVTNALKFSADHVEVTLQRIERRAELRVVDHGPGIPTAHAHRLFQRFTRLPYAGPGVRPSGSGLGLFITHELAAAHAGTLVHEPTPGGGATFVVCLPVTTGRTTA